MEINGTNPLIVSNNNVQRVDAPQQAEHAPKKGEEHSASDRLELSIRGREISHLEELVHSAPDIREGRVEELRREVERGTYNIKAEKIAEKIIGGNLLDEIF
jgi:negative regulator of flagellin synthesis FlgM